MIYVMRYKGVRELTKEDATRLLEDHGIKVLDGSVLPKMAKIEGEDVHINALKNDWDFYPEKTYSVPDKRKRVKK